MAKIYNTVSKNNNIFKEDTPNTACLNEFGTIFMRPDPPVDIDYINATYILDYVNKETLILNSPKALRDFNEKNYILINSRIWRQKNIVSANKNIIKEFLF